MLTEEKNGDLNSLVSVAGQGGSLDEESISACV
jgi:hypothetical protein